MARCVPVTTNEDRLDPNSGIKFSPLIMYDAIILGRLPGAVVLSVCSIGAVMDLRRLFMLIEAMVAFHASSKKSINSPKNKI